MALGTIRRGMLLAVTLAVIAAVFGYVAASQALAQRGEPQLPDPVQIQYLCVDEGTNIVRFDEDGVCPGGRQLLTIPDDYPLSFCYNQYDGALRLMTGASCPANFTTFEVPVDGQFDACINQYTNVLRAANGQECRSHERAAMVSAPAPVADPQNVATDEDAPVDITLTGSSSLPSPDGDLTFQLVDQPDNGTLIALFNETATSADVTYTPDPGYNGPDSFTFTVTDAFATSAEATVDITVNSVNDAPVAQDDAFTTTEDASFVADLLSNNGNGPDSDLDNDPLTVVQVDEAAFTSGSPITLTSGATLTVNSDGTFSYDPSTSATFQALGDEESDTDSFTYAISDGAATSNAATVTITVNGVNDAPLAAADTYDAIGNTLLAFDVAGPFNEPVLTFDLLTFDLLEDVLANDSDPEGDAVSVVPASFTAPDGGVVQIFADGSFRYTPPPGERTSGTFEYTLTDGTNQSTGTVTVNINSMAWYVENTNAGGAGTSTNPFQQLSQAESASLAGDAIFVYEGDGTTANQNSGIVLKDNQLLFSEAVDFYVPVNGGLVLLFIGDPANRPVIGNSGGDVVALEDNNGIAGFQINATAGAGVVGNGDSGGAFGFSVINIGGGSGTSDGISLTNHSVQFVIGDTTIEGTSSGDALFISGGDAAMILAGSAFNTSGGRLFDITQYGGMFDFRDSTVGTNDHAGLSITDSSAGATYVDLPDIVTTTAYSSPLVNLTNNPNQSFRFSRIAVTNTNGPGVVVSDASQFIVPNSTTFINTANGQGLSLSNVPGVFVDFTSVTVANSSAIGVNLVSNGGTVRLGALDVTTTGAAGLVATSAGTVNATSGTIEATNAPAVDINGTALGMTLTTVSSSNNATAGIRLTNATGSFVASGGTLQGITGTTLDINGGDGTLTYGGTITNTANRSVAIQSRTGGAVTVSGTVNDTGTGVLVNGNSAGTSTFSGTLNVDTGANAALSLTSNTGHTVDFSATFDVDTTSGAGLTATGGGTLTGDIAGSIVTQTGIAINVVNTSFGTGGLIIDAVSVGTGSSGPASGIILNNTGSAGGLSVTGDGSASQGSNGTGGWIQSTTGAGVSLSETANVSLQHMLISNTGGHGIDGTSVNGFSLLSTTVGITGDGDNENGVQLVNSTGALTVNYVLFLSASENLFAVYNTDADATVNVTNSVFAATDPPFGADAVTLQVQGNSAVDLNVNDNTFGAGTTGIAGQAVSIGNSVPGGSTPASGTVNFNADGNIIDLNPADLSKQGAFQVLADDSLTVNLDLTNNTFNGAKGASEGEGAISVAADASSRVAGYIGRAGEGNTITNVTNGAGILVAAGETADVVVVIEDNAISNTGADGIWIANVGSSDFGNPQPTTMDISLINNSVEEHNQGPNTSSGGIIIFGGGAAGGHTCVNFSNNTVTGTPMGLLDYAVASGAGSDPTLVQGPTSDIVTAADIQTLNNQPAANVIVNGAVFSGGVPCQTPS